MKLLLHIVPLQCNLFLFFLVYTFTRVSAKKHSLHKFGVCKGDFTDVQTGKKSNRIFRLAYCNRYCGRGQLFGILGGRFGLSRKKDIPRWMKSKWFRYGFLIFFFVMFFQMLWNTYLVFAGVQDLKQVVTLLWTFKLPWNWAYHGTLFHPGVAQFAFGFYSVMLTSTVLGLITMVLYKPRSWCVYCPMGTMTQLICKVKDKKDG